jgi:D-alanine-D-alanine ligase
LNSLSKKFNKVAVVMGGPSAEREVSLRSGAAVAKGLREAGYDAVEIDLKGTTLKLPAGIEAVFIALHGEFGEDGQIQEILSKQGMPFTGSGADACRNAFDKILSKKIFVKNHIPTPRWEILTKGAVNRQLKLPVVAKPAKQGSSIGVHRVFAESEWERAIKDAFQYDENVIVEEFIAGRELTVGIVNDKPMPVIEIVAPDGWYSYEAKYTKGKTEYLVPAPLEKKVYGRCQELAARTFLALKCRGLGRIDFRCSEKGELYVLELNNIPGFTETSLLPKAAAQAGISFPELCDMIMSSAAIHA